jgi:hypothetical protein
MGGDGCSVLEIFFHVERGDLVARQLIYPSINGMPTNLDEDQSNTEEESFVGGSLSENEQRLTR